MIEVQNLSKRYGEKLAVDAKAANHYLRLSVRRPFTVASGAGVGQQLLDHAP